MLFNFKKTKNNINKIKNEFKDFLKSEYSCLYLLRRKFIFTKKNENNFTDKFIENPNKKYFISNINKINNSNYTKKSLLNSNFIKSNFSDNSNIIQNTNTPKKLTNENILFLKKLNNFRNNEVEYVLLNTECIFQTIWSDFAYVCFINNDENFKNNLQKTNIDFIRTDDDSYSIFQDENAFIDYEESNEFGKYDYKIENENSTTSQKFILKNYRSKNENSNKEKNYTLICRIPQEFNINLKTNKDVKILNMGDSKLLADKQFIINFSNFEEVKNIDENSNVIKNKTVNLDLKRIRSKNIKINAEKGFNLNLTAKSYMEAENLEINIPESSILRLKKIGITNLAEINLKNSSLDVRSVFGPNINIREEIEESNKKPNNQETGNQTLNYILYNCEKSLINIGSIQGNNYFNLNSCNLTIDNIDCTSFILKSKNTDEIRIFLNSFRNLSKDDFFYLEFLDEIIQDYSSAFSSINDKKLDREHVFKNKNIFINEDHKNDILILNVQPEILKSFKFLNMEENDFQSQLKKNIFNIIYGESNLLSMLIQNNKNLYDIDQINLNFLQFMRETNANRNFILRNLKENNFFSKLKAVEEDIEESILMINYYFHNVLLSDVKNSYKIVFINSSSEESSTFEIKEKTAWDITRMRFKFVNKY